MNTKNENIDPPIGWKTQKSRLERIIPTEKYAKGVEYVFLIARIATEHNHHPEITLKYGSVEISTYSHDENSVTQRDIDLAEAINEIIAP